jgi:putative ABC transport system permease protein
MTSFKLVYKNLFRKKLRAFLLLIVIAVAFLIFGILGAVGTAFDTTPSTAGAQRLVVSNRVNFTQPLPIAYVGQIAQVQGVDKVSHLSWIGAYYKEPSNVLAGFAVDAQSYLDLYPDYLITPQARQAFLQDRQALLIGRGLAERLGIKVGQTISIFSNIFSQKDGSRSWQYKVVGLIDVAPNSPPVNALYVRYDYFNESRSFGRDLIGQVVVRSTSTAQNDAVITAIDAKFANARAQTATQTEEAFSRAFVAQFGNIALIITLVVGAAFITILMIIGNSMVSAVRERTREIAVLKTLGFQPGYILRLVLSEALLLALLGGLIGLGLAALVVAGLKQQLAGFLDGLKMSPLIWAQGIGLIFLLATLTGLIPALSAMRLNILTALGRR